MKNKWKNKLSALWFAMNPIYRQEDGEKLTTIDEKVISLIDRGDILTEMDFEPYYLEYLKENKRLYDAYVINYDLDEKELAEDKEKIAKLNKKIIAGWEAKQKELQKQQEQVQTILNNL